MNPNDSNNPYKYVALVENSVNRFYKNYYVGLRLKTFNYEMVPCLVNSESVCPRIKNQFPGIFDVAYGGDQSINPWTMHEGVIRIQSTYPLPFFPALHLFGSVYLTLTKRPPPTNNAVYVLAPGNVQVSDPTVYEASVNPIPRDQYRIGVGLDLIQAIKALNQAKVTISPISPDKASVEAGGAISFLANVTGSSDTAITWKISPPSGSSADIGKIDPSSGKYSAPASVDKTIQVTVTATAHADTGKSSTTTFTLNPKAASTTATPKIDRLSQNTAKAGAAELTLTVTGSIFIDKVSAVM